MPYNKIGSLTVHVLTAGGALPIERANVRVFGSDEENRSFDVSLLTDVSGLCKIENLPCPSAQLSLSPNPQSKPFAGYEIEIYADGYYGKIISGVALFESITTLQNALMIPQGTVKLEDEPRGNLIVNSTQNLYSE